MKRVLVDRCQRVKELHRITVCRRYEACLARNNPRASASDIAEAEAAERLAASFCDKELQELIKDIDESMREDGIAPNDIYTSHRLAVSLAFVDTYCRGNRPATDSGAHN